jgi:hypothetical protein
VATAIVITYGSSADGGDASVERGHPARAAVVMSVVAMMIPPFAAIVGNRDTDHSDNTDQHL